MIYLGWHPHVWWQYSILQSFMVLLACEFPCHQRSRYWCRHPAGGEQVLREKGCLSATPGHRSTLKAVMSPNLEGIFSASYNSSEMVLVTFCHVWFGPVTVEGYCSWRKSGPMNVFLTNGDPSQCPAVFFFRHCVCFRVVYASMMLGYNQIGEIPFLWPTRPREDNGR